MRVLSNEIDSRNLLEALDDDAKGRSPEVLTPPVLEQLAQATGVLCFGVVTDVRARLDRDRLVNCNVRSLHFVICEVLFV